MAEKGKKARTKKMTPRPPKATSVSKAKAQKEPKTLSIKATNAPSKATAAYDDLKPAPRPVLGNIPWGYGDVRIVGMARDPVWACAYWEISDEAIKAAQAKLHDPQAGLSLRVYDTTGRDFNGLNAHLHWDLGIDRNTNVYHFKVGKPGTTIHVDVGVRNWEGGFQPIARSNAIEMPRDSVSPNSKVEATTVFRSGPAYTYRHRYHAPPAGPGPGPGPSSNPAGHFNSAYPAESEQMFRHLSNEGWTRSEWMETMIDGRVMRWIRWSGPIMAEHLPFLPKTGASYRTVEVLFQGERRIIKMEGGEKIVYGPWKVVVEAVGGQGERKTIEQWMIRQRWTTHEGMIRVETPAILTRILGGRRVTVVQSGSEVRLAQEEWGSQVLQQGASEWRWIGASENMLQGSSEVVQRGASELFYMGSSERIYQGASETIYLGASEKLGASEMMGASEMLFLGASDTFDLGSSENLGGSSEGRP
ncbi:MAG TPA: DUF4912 domain-containing protein, partial [Planctomycetota bacterium]|nr:DUF4912 domain-containing protein [Planctomycetota bacterium]